MKKRLYQNILISKEKNKKLFSILIDPDKFHFSVIEKANKAGVDFFFIGGSILTNGNLDECVRIIKENSRIPIVLFPGNTFQINKQADALLFLSLISGRNSDMLIGKQVIAAPMLKNTELEIISTGYVLIDGGKPTTVSYISNTFPIPSDKVDVAACTALAGELLGLKMIYLESGSGALYPVSNVMIEAVRKQISIPIIVGGGIKTPKQAVDACNAGADMIVMGNAIEKDEKLISSVAKAVHQL